MSNGIKSYMIAQGIVAILNDANKKGLVIDIAEKIDQVADKDLGSKSEKVQQRVVEVILIPLCRELMKENPIEYNRILTVSLVEVPNAEKEKN